MQRSKQLLLSGIALIACLGAASAQGIKEEGGARSSEQGVTSSRPGAQRGSEMRGQGQVENRAKSIDGKASSANQHSERSTTSHSEKNEVSGKSASKVEGEGKAERRSGSPAQRDQKSAQELKKERTSGPAPSKNNEPSTVGQGSSGRNEASKASSHQGPSSSQRQPDKSTSGSTELSNTKASGTEERNAATGVASPQGQQTTGASEQGATQSATQQPDTSIRSQAGATINTQQQAKIQQSVLSARNVPRVNDVNFDIRVNAVVPSHVHVVGLSSFPVLVEAFPRYRDDSFFVVEDDIVIVDHSHRIVDVVPAGPKSRYGRVGSPSSTAAVIDLTEPEIREVQQVLIDRGYYHGPVDGIFRPEVREALISFQRKEGFEATGRVDTRTVSALGLSGRIGQNAQGAGNQSTTNAQQPSDQSGTGQATQRQQNSSGQTTSAGQKQSQNQPASGANNQPSQRSQNGPAPATSGQGASQDPGATNQPHSRMKSQGSQEPRNRHPSER
jgi:hypothetical protein